MKFGFVLLISILFINNIFLLVTSSKIKKLKKSLVCPAIECGKNDDLTEVEKWECHGKYLFNATSGDPSEEYYVEHNCFGVGWGNAIRGFYNAAAISTLLGRRLIVSYDPFNKMFNPPNGVSRWDYKLTTAFAKKGMNYHQEKETFDYEMHGRSPNRFSNFAKNLTKQSKIKKTNEKTSISNDYKKTVLIAGVCGGDREFFYTGDCMLNIFPKFGKCSQQNGGQQFDNNMLSIPFFHNLFSSPSNELVMKLNQIRTRLSLPSLDTNIEKIPGSLGLFTPGYYIFAMHFRKVPLGFEPMSVELNKENNKKWRDELLEAYWFQVDKFAKEAKDIAKCRNEKLLIYFATDDVVNLRPKAVRLLSKYGKVIFGLDSDEVGHVRPSWNPGAETEVLEAAKQKALELQKIYSTKQLESGRHEESNVNIDGDSTKTDLQLNNNLDTNSLISSNPYEILNPLNGEKILVPVLKDMESTANHAIFCIVEWWILANAQWLISHSGTSYSDIAGGVGLGPNHKMERMDVIHGKNHYITSRRRDWNGDACTVVYSADPEQSINCPNNMK